SRGRIRRDRHRGHRDCRASGELGSGPAGRQLPRSAVRPRNDRRRAGGLTRDIMRANSQGRRIWISGSPVDVWEHPDATFSWTPNAIKLYLRREQWESLFNALVLLGDSEPKGAGA